MTPPPSSTAAKAGLLSLPCNYFFLNPIGHFGFNPVTDLVDLPFVHIIVVCFLAVVAGTDGVGVAIAFGVGLTDGVGTTCCNATFTVGEEKVNPLAAKCTQPFFSWKEVVATSFVPWESVIETVAVIGALENLYRHRAYWEFMIRS
jgi:hypothetical protein